MDGINRTLYIPLYGKAYVSRKGILLSDPKAEEIWASEGFALRGKAASKWLAYYMGMRARVFDRWLYQKRMKCLDGMILHIGCGMDSRITRVGTGDLLWYDIDMPDVIAQRRRYYQEDSHYHMLEADVRTFQWISSLPQCKTALVVMEGVSMYLSQNELVSLMKKLGEQFDSLALLMDCYTVFAARASKFRNPIHAVGASRVYGVGDPEELAGPSGLAFLREHNMTPGELIKELPPIQRKIFRLIYGGRISRNLYRLYEYGK